MTNELPAPIRTSREVSLEAEVTVLRDLLAGAEARGYRTAIERLRELSQHSRTARGPQMWFDVDTAKKHAAYLEASEGAN